MFERNTVITLVVLLAILLLAAGGVWWAVERNNAKSLQESLAGVALTPPATAAGYTDLEGNALSLEQHVGKVLVVYSWASWCPQCAADLKVLQAVAAPYTDSEVVVLAINRGEPAMTAERYLARTLGDTARVQLVLDPEDSFYASIGGYAMPETVIFGLDGSEQSRIRTTLEAATLDSKIKTLLAAE